MITYDASDESVLVLCTACAYRSIHANNFAAAICGDRHIAEVHEDNYERAYRARRRLERQNKK